ncbi:MAG: hypothetical protein IJ206_07280 [Oscillospiraceae bacterium]|nr:hypothetical protein [Oscillospiraceae bacterium]
MKVCSSIREVPEGFFLADCAVSGGTMTDYIRYLMDASGGKLCVVLESVYMDFQLPCPGGRGDPVSPEELGKLRQDLPCYYSEDLCTNYFTFCRDREPHAVLFDSLQSLRKKYAALEQGGVPMVLIEDPELRQNIPPGAVPDYIQEIKSTPPYGGVPKTHNERNQ